MRAALLALLVVLAGCPDDDPDPDSTVPPPPVEGGTAEIVLGTGFVDPDTLEGWVDLTDGFDAELVRGPQGGQHVWLNIRQRGLVPMRMTIHMRLFVLDDAMGMDLPEPVEGGRADLRLSFQPQRGGTGYYEVANLTLFVPEPDDVVGHRCRIEVQLVDTAGAMAIEDVDVNVDWAPGQVVPGRDGGPRDGGADGATMDAGPIDGGASDASPDV